MWQGYPEFYGPVDETGVAASMWNFFREGTLRPTEFHLVVATKYNGAFTAFGLVRRPGLPV